MKFSKESLSFIKMVSAPANIVCSIVSSYLSSEKPFTYIFYTTIACICVSSYSILVLCYNFPTDEETQQDRSTIMHYSVVSLMNDLVQNFWFVITFALIAQITDKRIAGIHITLLVSFTNFA